MATEKWLIDAKALFNDLADYWGIPKDWDGRIEQTCEDALSMIENYPTVDAVEVVRCKDCKHSVWDEENEMWKCVESADYDEGTGEWFGFYEYHNGDFFCSYGERRPDGK